MFGTASPPTHSPSIRLLCSVISRSFPRQMRPRPGQVAHQRGGAEGPFRRLGGEAHGVDERPEPRRGDGDDVARVVGEALPRRVAVLHRREHRAEEQHQPVRILVVPPDGLRHEVGRVAADLAHRRAALHAEAVGALDRHRELRRPHVVEAEAVVEEPDERPDGAGGVVVLGLAEQERRAPLDVAQVHVVAEARAPDPPAAVDRQHHLRLGVVPLRHRMQADRRAPADRRHRLALGEDLGVRPDAHLEILAPQPLAPAAPPWPRPPPRSPARCRASEAPISPAIRPRIASALAGSPAARSSITRSTIERAKVTPQALSACRSQGARQRDRPRPPPGEPSGRPTVAREPPDRVVQLQEVAHRRHLARGDVDQRPVPHGDHARPIHARDPDPPDPGAALVRRMRQRAGHAAPPPAAMLMGLVLPLGPSLPARSEGHDSHAAAGCKPGPLTPW